MKLARHDFSPLGASALPAAWQILARRIRVGATSRVRALLPLALTVDTLHAAPNPQQEVPDTLDLKTSVTFALENNFAIRQARERIKQQEGIVVEVSAREIPNVGANAAYQRNDKTISSSFPASDQAWQINL